MPRSRHSDAAEDYLKAVFALAKESPTREAGMKAIATVVGVTTGTATTMVKRLAQRKLARYQRFGGVSLTPAGERAALDILRRHRLIETFLVKTLGLDWSLVHAEAERLEHAVSPLVLDALDRHLGHPAADPHGDPIPDADGRLSPIRARPLAALHPGDRARVVRIADQDAAFLTFIARHHLRPGTLLTVLAADAAAQALLVRADSPALSTAPSVSMALAAASKIHVEPLPPPR
jgi:DtxR family Mn-dependent transcriptional regulator